MFKQDTREILKSLIPITNKFVIQSPRIVFTDEFKQIVCSFDVSQIEEFKEKIAINDMANFLSAADLLEDPEITIKDRIINIKNSKSSIKYLTSDLKSIDETSYKVVESTKGVNTIFSFTMSTDLIESLSKAMQVFKTSDTVFIKKEGESVSISLGQNESFNAATNEFSINIEDYDSSTDFEVKIPAQSLLRIPTLEYNFEVKYNEERDSYRIYLSNQVLEIVLSTIR